MANKEIVKYINFYIYDLAVYYVNIIMIILTLISIFHIHSILFLIQFLYFPLAILPVKLFNKNIAMEIKEITFNNAKINQIKADLLKNIDYVKLNRLEEKKIKELEEYNDRINSVWGKVAALETTSGIWANGFAKVLFTGISFSLGTLFVLRNTMTIGELIALISYVAILYGYINSVLSTNIKDIKNNAEFETTLKFLQLPDIDDSLGLKFEFKDCITFKNVCFSYVAQREVLKDLNITFEYNKWTTITGKSGVGKSTIFDLITKLYDEYTGEIYVDQTNLKHISVFDLREHVTKISQDVYLFPGTIKDNLLLINNQISDANINQLMRFVCLDQYIDSLPNKMNTDIGEAGKLMSGGEKQRLSLALGLLRNNKVLLLDEISSNLDEDTEFTIAQNLRRLMDNGYTIISISHRSTFNQFSDRIIELK